MPSEISNQNVNDSFFDGQYKELWRSFIPEELTKREIDFIIQYFSMLAGNNVLDIMCGYGRHSIGLARKGIRVTAVDNQKKYVEEIQRIALSEDLSLKAICSNVLSYTWYDKFDLAICMGNSFNFFDEECARKLLIAVGGSLKAGGHFLINTWSLAETIIKGFAEKSWSYRDDYKVLMDSAYLFCPTRIETEFTIIGKEGETETKKAIDYVYSYSEMQKMLEASGFVMKEVFSIPGKKKFAVGEPRAYIIAEKV